MCHLKSDLHLIFKKTSPPDCKNGHSCPLGASKTHVQLYGNASRSLPTEASVPIRENTTVKEGIASKSFYNVGANIPTTVCLKLPSEEKARHFCHKGISNIIFKAFDYYGVMAEEC
ncbi:hypothetical protein FXO38_25622 [Capsicum annuum]|nr:hypothetical protein FXO37_29191 [Capsicum annuum]KAF3633395.1 hypothetical protein FXO38_25622 [Capsicum annuum]